MEIVFLGTSCMVPTKDRNHQGIFVFYKNTGILVDCGEGIQRQLKIADIKPTRIDKIFITHWHGDHVLGLPGLLQTLNSAGYDKKLEIYGPIGTKKNFEHMFKAFGFYIGFEHEIIEIETSISTFRDVIVESLPLEHSIVCLGYSIKEIDRRRIRPAVIKKLGIPDGPLLGEIQDNKSINWKGKIITPEDASYVVKGKKIAIVLDTIVCNNAIKLANDADLLISEASYASDLENKAEDYKHLTAGQAAHIAHDANVKKLILTHLSQRYKSPVDILNDAKDIFSNVLVAYDFMKLKI
ncbi:MAG: ribonuclease Z [archaeon]